MPRRKPKLGKIVIVLFLTALIWIWADLALDETPPPRRARVVVGESSEDIWVSFGQAPHVDVEVTLSGPHSAFNALDRLLKKQPTNNRLDFSFVASLEKMDKPGPHKLVLLDFLQKNERLRRLGLKVKDCDPNSINVNVVGLSERELDVECIDENNDELTPESINPPKVIMYAPESFRAATVRLSPHMIKTARSEQIEATPYIMLAPNQKRTAAKPVRVKFAADESPLAGRTIENARLHVSMSPALVGKYQIEIINLDDVIRTIQIRATVGARDSYQAMPYHVRLELDEKDTEPNAPPKVVIYNFPQDALRANEIELAQPPEEAQFKLTKISPETK